MPFRHQEWSKTSRICRHRALGVGASDRGVSGPRGPTAVGCLDREAPLPRGPTAAAMGIIKKYALGLPESEQLACVD
jgi:hypothetical protein